MSIAIVRATRYMIVSRFENSTDVNIRLNLESDNPPREVQPRVSKVFWAGNIACIGWSRQADAIRVQISIFRGVSGTLNRPLLLTQAAFRLAWS